MTNPPITPNRNHEVRMRNLHEISQQILIDMAQSVAEEKRSTRPSRTWRSSATYIFSSLSVTKSGITTYRIYHHNLSLEMIGCMLTKPRKTNKPEHSMKLIHRSKTSIRRIYNFQHDSWCHRIWSLVWFWLQWATIDHRIIAVLISLYSALYILTLRSQIPVSSHGMIYNVLLTECKILSPHSVYLPEAHQRWLILGRCKVRTGIVDSHCQTLQICPCGYCQLLV